MHAEDNGNGTPTVIYPPEEHKTGKVITRRLLRDSRTIKFIVAGIAAVFVGGYMASVFLADRFEGSREAEAAHRSAAMRLDRVESAAGALDKRQGMLEEDLHWIERSEELIQRALGVKADPTPEHAP